MKSSKERNNARDDQSTAATTSENNAGTGQG